MDFSRAASQIAQIHDQLAKTEVYRGVRSVPVAFSAACGFAGVGLEAWLFPASSPPRSPLEVVVFWSVVGIVSGLVGTSELIFNYFFRDDPLSRRKARRVAGQFVPAAFAGAAVTLAALRSNESLVPLLPGLWALLFGLGVFASRPYLPRAIGWVGLYYVCTGALLLALAADQPVLAGWQVGGTFGCGQVGAAVVFYRNREREDHG